MTYPLTQEKIDFYRTNEFVPLDNVLSEAELEELRRYVEEVMNADGQLSVQTAKPGDLYYRILNQRVTTWRDHACRQAHLMTDDKSFRLGDTLQGRFFLFIS